MASAFFCFLAGLAAGFGAGSGALDASAAGAAAAGRPGADQVGACSGPSRRGARPRPGPPPRPQAAARGDHRRLDEALLALLDESLGRLLGGNLQQPKIDQVGPEHRDWYVTLDLVAIPRELRDPLAVDLLLEGDEPIQEGLGGRRAAGDVDVDGEVFVDPGDDVVPLLERASTGGAGTHAHHVFRLGHLVVEPRDHRHHRLGDGARDDHHVGLAGRPAEDLGAEAGDVEPARRRADHLDRAAGQAESERPEARPPAPVVDGVDDPQQLVPARHQDVLLQLLLKHGIDLDAPLGSRGRRARHRCLRPHRGSHLGREKVRPRREAIGGRPGVAGDPRPKLRSS